MEYRSHQNKIHWRHTYVSSPVLVSSCAHDSHQSSSFYQKHNKEYSSRCYSSILYFFILYSLIIHWSDNVLLSSPRGSGFSHYHHCQTKAKNLHSGVRWHILLQIGVTLLPGITLQKNCSYWFRERTTVCKNVSVIYRKFINNY